MTGSQPRSRSRGRFRALLGAVRDDLWTIVAAIVTFLAVSLATFLSSRAVAWSALKADLAGLEATIVAVTPWDVILLQATVGLVVGFVFAVEVVCYRKREVFLSGGSSRFPLSAGVRRVLVVAGLAVFALGALAGYEQVLPVVVETLATGGQWSIVGLGRIAAAVAVASGLAAQAGLVGAVLAYGRGGGPPSTPDAETD
jgi:sec-independent protein translocase protein TatC